MPSLVPGVLQGGRVKRKMNERDESGEDGCVVERMARDPPTSARAKAAFTSLDRFSLLQDLRTLVPPPRIRAFSENL